GHVAIRLFCFSCECSIANAEMRKTMQNGNGNGSSQTGNKAGYALVQQLKAFYEHYDVSKLDKLSDIYTQDIEFVDPIERIQGIFALKKYLSKQGVGLNYSRFHYHSELIGDNKAFIRWDMVFSHPRLAKGRELTLSGMSELHFTNRIYFQQDSYDL